MVSKVNSINKTSALKGNLKGNGHRINQIAMRLKNALQAKCAGISPDGRTVVLNNQPLVQVFKQKLDDLDGNVDGKNAAAVKKRKVATVENRFISGQNLKVEINDKKWFQCESCSYSSNISTHYKNHQRTHTVDRPYLCPETGCGKAFT